MEELKNYYDVAAPTFELVYSPNGIINERLKADILLDISKFKEILAKLSYSSLLDLGCGTGYWMSFYYRSDARLITGVDISSKMGSAFQDRREESINVVFIAGDIFSYLSTCTEKYDVIIISFVLSHYLDGEVMKLFSAVKPCLSSCGKVLIQDSSWSMLRKQEVSKLIFKKNSENGKILKIYRSKKEIANLIKATGFNVVCGNYGRAFFYYLIVVDPHFLNN